MNWGLLLFPAVGGYWLLTHWHFTRYQVSRQSGYHVLFRSAAYGIALYFCADRFATLCGDECWVRELNMLIQFLDEHAPNPLTTESALTLIMALVLPPIFNLFYSPTRGVRRAVRDAGEDVELLILDSLRNGTLIEITLENRKVYIGMAARSGVGNSPDADAAIVPQLSGYREEKTLALQIDTAYTTVLSQHIRGDADFDGQVDSDSSREELERFRVVIPMSRIVSARPFEQVVFDDFFAARWNSEVSGSTMPPIDEASKGDTNNEQSQPSQRDQRIT